MNGELPKGWVWTSLEKCIDILDNRRSPINAEEREKRIKDKDQSGLYPYYGATGQVGLIDEYIFDEELILLGEDGAPFLDFTKDKSYLIKGKTWVNNHAHVLRAIKDMSLNSYICHYLNSFDYRNYITGTTRYKLNQSQMRKISIPLPPLAEQQRIVNKIEELFTNLDKGVESLEEVKYKLKVYRQAILKYAMEGKLTEKWREENKEELIQDCLLIKSEIKNINKESKYYYYTNEVILHDLPKTWAWVKLENISNCLGGYAYKSKDFTENGYQVVKIGNIKMGSLDLDNKPSFIEKIDFNNIKKYLLLENDVLISLTGTKNKRDYGNVAIIKKESNLLLNQRIGRLRFYSFVLPKYYYFNLQVENFRNQFFQNETGNVGQGNVGMDAIKSTFVTLPTYKEQNIIVERIEKLFSLADYIEETVNSKLEQSKILRQSILKKAFEGKLVPQYPNDEPAELLLERIKMEKPNKEKLVQEKLI